MAKPQVVKAKGRGNYLYLGADGKYVLLGKADRAKIIREAKAGAPTERDPAVVQLVQAHETALRRRRYRRFTYAAVALALAGGAYWKFRPQTENPILSCPKPLTWACVVDNARMTQNAGRTPGTPMYEGVYAVVLPGYTVNLTRSMGGEKREGSGVIVRIPAGTVFRIDGPVDRNEVPSTTASVDVDGERGAGFVPTWAPIAPVRPDDARAIKAEADLRQFTPGR